MGGSTSRSIACSCCKLVVTLKQLEEADKRLWSVLAERTRSGIKVSPEGRPCDKVFVQCFESTEVMHYLQPMLSTTQDWPSARPTKRFRGHGDDEASDTKVKGKGRFFFSRRSSAR